MTSTCSRPSLGPNGTLLSPSLPAAHRLYQEDPQESVRQCTALLDEPNLDTAVRMGDVYGLLVEHYSHASNHQQVRCRSWGRCGWADWETVCRPVLPCAHTVHVVLSRVYQAYSLMEEMRKRMPSVNMAFYVDMKTIEAVHQALGIPLGSGMGGAPAGDEGDSELEESVGEVEDD